MDDMKDSRLFQAFFGKQDPPMPDLPPVTMRPLADMIRRLKKVDDLAWGRYSFSREPLNGKFNDEDRARLTKESNRCGQEYADKISAKYHTSDPISLAKEMELQISYPQLPANLLRVIFAEYKSKNQIFIYMDAVHKAEELLKDDEVKEVIGDSLDITRLLLAHELFHYVEEIYEKEIFTKTEKVELWAPLFFRNRSAIFCLSELAAMEFARKLTNLPYSAFLMDVFLVYGYDHETACRIYEEIMEIAGLNPDDCQDEII